MRTKQGRTTIVGREGNTNRPMVQAKSKWGRSVRQREFRRFRSHRPLREGSRWDRPVFRRQGWIQGRRQRRPWKRGRRPWGRKRLKKRTRKGRRRAARLSPKVRRGWT